MLYFTEHNAQIITGIEASLGFNNRQCQKSLLAGIRGRKWDQKSHCSITNYWLLLQKIILAHLSHLGTTHVWVMTDALRTTVLVLFICQITYISIEDECKYKETVQLF